MKAVCLTPILNVSDLTASFAWFQKLGWEKKWDWGEPASFGAVAYGECEIFLCLNSQGGQGKGQNTQTFGPNGSETQDQGCWMSVWVNDVDEAHTLALAQGIEVVFPPTDMPWGVRECHLRHPDGYVFRVTRGCAES